MEKDLPEDVALHVGAKQILLVNTTDKSQFITHKAFNLQKCIIRRLRD
jgi:hypothetical protein